MAKRIIKYGKYNTVTCSECQCEFAFDNVDLEENGNDTCPLCGAETTPEKP